MTSMAERFWSKVQKSDGCWEWQAGVRWRASLFRYGNFTVDGKSERAHRVAWGLTFGLVPDGLWVLHRCDNPICVRPDHLFLGTAMDNVQDCRSKGRWNGPLPGEHNHQAKLTEDQVREIRHQVESGVPKRVVARAFGVSPRQVRRIVSRVKWSSVS